MYIEVHISLLFYRSYPKGCIEFLSKLIKIRKWQQRAADKIKCSQSAYFSLWFALKLCSCNGTLSIDYCITQTTGF